MLVFALLARRKSKCFFFLDARREIFETPRKPFSLRIVIFMDPTKT